MQVSETIEEKPQLKQFSSWRLNLIYAVLALVVVAVLSFNIFRPIVVLPRIKLAPGYALTNQAGETITSESRRGQLTLYSFSYAECEGEWCRQTAVDLHQIHQGLQENQLDVELITISLNPEQDTPQNLSQLAQRHDLQWDWLTGDPLRIKYVVGGGFDLYYQNKATSQIDFQPRFILVDGLGIIRAYYHTNMPDMALLQRDINYIEEEIANSTGPTKLAYEAAHLFLCYPR